MAFVSVDRFHRGTMFGQDEGVVESWCKRVVPILSHARSGGDILEAKVADYYPANLRRIKAMCVDH